MLGRSSRRGSNAGPRRNDDDDDDDSSSQQPPRAHDVRDAPTLIALSTLPAAVAPASMSSPRASRAWDMPPASTSRQHQQPAHASRPRRSSSSLRGRPRNESSASSLLPYDPDAYTDDLIPQDVIFDGPSASSVPTSVSQFAHRGSRTSFAEDGAIERPRFFAHDFDSDAEDVLTEIDPEEEERHSISLASSRISEVSSAAISSSPDIEHRDSFGPLLVSASGARVRRKSSDVRSEGSLGREGGRTQKIYIADEDLVVVVSGFRTRRQRLWIYNLLCVVSLGIVYLVMRWMPRWRLKLLADPLPLSEAHWVVVEVQKPLVPAVTDDIQNQYSDLSIHRIKSTVYGLPLSSLFAPSTPEEADDDPVLEEIRYLDYRYIRFVFHPLRAKFQLMSNWRDPSWRSLKDITNGLEGETRDARAGLFGDNVIDIDEKPIIQLLMDEVETLVEPNTKTIPCRSCTRSTFSKSSPLSSGPWTSIITTRLASSS